MGSLTYRRAKKNWSRPPHASLPRRLDLKGSRAPATMEPDTDGGLLTGNHHEPLSDSHRSNLSGSISTALSEPTLTAGQLAEVSHRSAKAAIYESRTEHRGSTNVGNRLKEQAETIQALNARILALEKSERHLRTRLLEEKESLKDSKADLQAAHYQASILEEQLDIKISAEKELQAMLERYQGWWLNEYYCLKVALQLIPDPDDGIVVMQESSQARFLVHLASQSDCI